MVPYPEDRPTMTVEEAADALGIGRSAAYERARDGQLPSIRFGRRIVIPTASLRSLLGLPIERPAA